VTLSRRALIIPSGAPKLDHADAPPPYDADMTPSPRLPIVLNLAIFAAATFTTALAQQSPGGNAPAVTGQPTPKQAQQIIERLSWQYTGPNPPTHVVYGAVPAALPVRLTAPIDVLVSFRMVYGSNVTHRILLGSDDAPDVVLQAVGAQLAATGWKPVYAYTPRAGFQSPQAEQSRTFYYVIPTGKGEGYSATLSVVSRGGQTNVDLNVGTAPATQIEGLKRAASYAPKSSLPALNALPGAKIKVGSASGSPNGLISTAYVTGTALGANGVLSHYNAQLKAAGWKAVTDTTTGPLRVITYALKDVNGREALGTLGIRPWEKEGGGFVLTASVQGFKP